MRRRLRDHVGKRGHCPFKVSKSKKGIIRMKKNPNFQVNLSQLHPLQPPSSELVVTVWQCTAAGCVL